MSQKKKKKLLPSKTAISRTLASASFDPRAEGPLHVIATTAGREYHEARAVELIRDAVDVLELNLDFETYKTKMLMAMGLMALAINETED